MTPRYPKRRDIRHRLVRTIERQRKDDISRVAETSDPSSGGGGIAAAVYDGFDIDTDPVAEQFNVTYKVVDSGAGGGDEGEIGQLSSATIPPNAANNWLRYVWYDDGFNADTGFFLIPEDGVYAVHARCGFQVINGLVKDCNLDIESAAVTSLYIARTDGPRGVAPGDSDVLLDCHGQAFLATGSEVRMGLSIAMSGLTGMSDSTILIKIPRTSLTNAPPTDAAGPGQNARFSITKISSTAPA